MNEAEWKAIIQEGTSHRGWIVNSYAQIEFLLGDLIVRCREFPQYEAHTRTVSHSATKRAAKVRSILAIDGPIAQFSAQIQNVLDGFEQNQELRNLLVHGFLIFAHTPDDDAGFWFRKFERPEAENQHLDHVLIEKTLRLIDLEYHRTQLIAQAQSAQKVFQEIHAAMGWGEIG